jgi:PilZ domain-containing protein
VTLERPGRTSDDRRRAPRFNISMPVTVTDAVSGRSYSATVDNVSLGGMLLLVDSHFAPGARLFINFPIAADMTMRVEAALVRTSDVGEFGVAFVSLTDEEHDRLAEFFDLRSREAD